MNQQGFTLLEILIALAIFALLSAAISGQTRSGIRTLHAMDLRFDAQLLAENYAEQQSAPSNIHQDSSRQTEDFFYNGRRWRSERDYETTPRVDMQKLTIRVYSQAIEQQGEQEAPLAELITYTFQSQARQ